MESTSAALAVRTSEIVAPAENAAIAFSTMSVSAAFSSSNLAFRKSLSISARYFSTPSDSSFFSAATSSGRGSRSSSVIFGYMFVPTALSFRRSSALKRCFSTSTICCCGYSSSRAFSIPPRDSIFWNSPQIFSAISLVSVSMPQEPPDGSIGRSIPNSSCSMMCTFLAIRRENSSPLRTVAS